MSVVNNETLTAGAAGTVRTVYVAEGDQVESGERLLRLSTGETLEASFDGTVNELSVEEGDEVAAGASLIQIVDFAHMKVTMRVDEYQISQVSEGQACRITVTALGETFDSEITHINRISASQGSTAYYTRDLRNGRHRGRAPRHGGYRDHSPGGSRGRGGPVQGRPVL